MAEPVLPVYLVHWDAPRWCASAVSSLATTKGLDIEVTVVDNGQTAGPALSEVLGPDVRVLASDANGGYTGGANLALRDWRRRYPGGDLCLIGSHDLHVEPDTLVLLTEAANAAPDTGVLAPRLVSPVAAAGGRWTGRRAYQLAPDSYSGVVDRDWASGTCLLLRRACVDAVGGFDERFGSYVEDVDYGLRARDNGWRTVVVLDAVARGMGSGGQDATLSIAANSVLLSAKRGGVPGALGSLALFTGWTARGLVATLAPWRSAQRRSVSWSYASQRLRALAGLMTSRRLYDVLRHPASGGGSST